ncbi:MAG TPA: serine/threonine-protein kinase [Pyrinomonadaceae bacterium]|nr:serine/threonine-protein kinase [Pyrinomonadaceae bacterium]
MAKDSSQDEADNLPNSGDAPTRIIDSSQPEQSEGIDAPTRIIDSAGQSSSSANNAESEEPPTRVMDPADSAAKKAVSPHSSSRSSTSSRNSTSFDSIDNARFVPGEIVAERYRIVGLLGKGGMGEVYRADDLKLGQAVALKFLPDHLTTDGAALARFHREVRIARQVSHQNVCRVYDIGEVEGRHFLSMEFIKGEELSSLLRRIGRLPSDKATEISRQLCAGLSAAHNRGVLHRDLKPANVMIDENGNVRLTDFGIAGLLDEGSSGEISGTPAYMSPEQLAGKELTLKSDIYSLGLVIYEIYTGKKVFDAPTLPQLLSLRNSDSTPTSPSLLVQNLDPLVERAILRCIEKDPEKRPASALEVAASLPGGDPLAAALAAGETPSPEMVAAAPRQGFLKPAVAVSLLAGILVATAVVVLLSEKTQLHRRVPLERSPELLQERARTIVTKLGYTEPFSDSTYGLTYDYPTLTYAETTNTAVLGQLATSRPATMLFWYRQSPDYLIPRTRLAVRASSSDPPATVSGMATVFLDPKGRLVEFLAVPPRKEEASKPTTTPNWSVLFEEAGFKQEDFTSKPSEWVPPVYSDARAAWEGKLSNELPIPIRIEAASYAGKPVLFKIIGPWNWRGQLRQPQSDSSLGKLIVLALLAITLAFFIIGVLLGRRNLRDGSGDRRGGARLAVYIFVALMIAWAFRARHLGAEDELNLLQLGIQFALLPTVLLWLFYLALEPYVRRWWPHRMVSWSRLLAGDFRDPLIGRDILIGAALGMTIMVVNNLWILTPGWFGHLRAPRPVTLHTLLGLRESVGELFFTGITLIVFLSVTCMFLLLLLHMIFRRRDWLALGAAWLLFTIVSGLSARPLKFSLIYAPVYSALLILAATRFGLLTLTATLFFTTLFSAYPMTMDFSIWYASSTIFALVVAGAVVVFAFYTSLGGQPVFKGQHSKQ